MMGGGYDEWCYRKWLLSAFALYLACSRRPVKLKALVDSGFDGQVALPYFAADRLRLEIARLAEVTYANGQRVEEIVCRGKILWDDEIRSVEIALSEDDEPAIGTKLLKGCMMTMDFIQDALTIVKPA